MPRFPFPALALALAPALALPQPAGNPEAPPPPPPQAEPAQGQPPAEAMPAQPPPPIPGGAQQQPPPGTAAAVAVRPAGQWVYTYQFGWLWIPYGRQYTYIPGDVQVFPDQYVYYPAYGWRWVVAPWVYGYGPAPYWGVLGIRPFAWYSRPWFRVGGYWGWGGYAGWGAYRGWVGPRTWGARGWVEAPAYYRTGVGGPHPAHAFRPDPVRRGPPVHQRGPGRHRGHER